jgi:hypothetical protein
VSQPHRGPDQQSASEQREHRPHKDRRSIFHRYALPTPGPQGGEAGTLRKRAGSGRANLR